MRRASLRVYFLGAAFFSHFFSTFLAAGLGAACDAAGVVRVKAGGWDVCETLDRHSSPKNEAGDGPWGRAWRRAWRQAWGRP